MEGPQALASSVALTHTHTHTYACVCTGEQAVPPPSTAQRPRALLACPAGLLSLKLTKANGNVFF